MSSNGLYVHFNHVTSNKEWTLLHATPQCVGMQLTFSIIQVTWPFDVCKQFLWSTLEWLTWSPVVCFSGGVGGTPILGAWYEGSAVMTFFLRFSIRLGALFSILKPLNQTGLIWLPPHCVEIQSNWPPFSQFPIQLTHFFWTLSDPIGPIYQACVEPPYQQFCPVPPPPPPLPTGCVSS